MPRQHAFRLLPMLVSMLLIYGILPVNSAVAQAAPQALVFSNFTCDTMASLGGCYNSSVDLSEIYRVNADGSGMVLLTAQPLEGFVYNLAVSPDGTRIAFLLTPAQRSGMMVYTMNVDGTNLQAILPDSAGRRYTSVLWSPDGTQLLLQDENSTTARQSLMSASGSEPEVITAFRTGLKIYVTEWAADGRFFAYDQMGGLLWVNPDGTERTPLPSIETTYYDPVAVPSHDLTHLAYFTQLEEPYGTDALIITDADGATEQTITDVVQTNTANLDVLPTLGWSPDDSLIAYIGHGETGTYSLMVIGADGTNRVSLTTAPIQVFGFDWIPSSGAIAAPEAATPQAATVSPAAPEATATLLQANCPIQAISTANLRGAPSNAAAIVRSLGAGETISADGQTTDAAGFVWWHVAEGAWVRSDVVTAPDSCASLPQATP